MKNILVGLALAALALSLCAGAAAGESPNLLPNPSFELGDIAPYGWLLSGAGEWTSQPEGGHCVTVTGNGVDQSDWCTNPLPVTPGCLYRLRYRVRRLPGSGGGVTIAGFDSANHDLRAGNEWQTEEFFFRLPDNLKKNRFRVGQWHVKGGAQFDDLSLLPAVAVHHRTDVLGLALGEGETIRGQTYTAEHRLGGAANNYCRFLDSATARFNTDRWVFSDGDEVVYFHRLGRLLQEAAEVEVDVSYYISGALVVEASRDHRQWVTLGRVEGLRRAKFSLPSSLLPARSIWVRLRADRHSDFQVDFYRYRSRLPEAKPDWSAIGETHLLALTCTSPDLAVRVDDLSTAAGRVALTLTSEGARGQVVAAAEVEGANGRTSRAQARALLTPHAVRRLTLPLRAVSAGRQTLRLSCRRPQNTAWGWEAEGSFTVSPLDDPSGGKLLSRDPRLAVWWCEPERKVSQTRPLPSARAAALQISAARNEYEPVQLILTPAQPLHDCRITVSDLAGPGGASLSSSDIELRQVAYVNIQQPTDDLGRPGLWPDPLPPLRGPVSLDANRNHPFWITVYVPPGMPAGDYRGEVTITAREAAARVPIRVHVWGFTLPAETHVRSGFGLSRSMIRRYHNLDTDEEVEKVRALYLESFARHRVSPYSFGRGIKVTWNKTPDGKVEPKLDFSGFDQDARRAFDRWHFNSFVLDLAGLGGGTYQSRHLGEIAGYQQGTPEYEAAFTKYVRALQDHLAQRGWLDKAYVYWFDEPGRKDFDFVRAGMELIHRAGPRITRMLTTHPTSELYGDVDLWCLPTYTLEPQVVKERQAAGEEVWWYLCTSPKAPYFTLFIDHYGTEMRVWLWETWKYGLQGILVWQTVWWTASPAYRNSLQNPWEDPMSWRDGRPGGWGNGDGRFFYPPNRHPGVDKTKYLEGPIPSIRWELLRDGIEDYEYLWLLRSKIQELKQSGADPAIYRDAEALLAVPPDICTDLQHFTTSPEPIHRQRRRVAEAIERLPHLTSGDPSGSS